MKELLNGLFTGKLKVPGDKSITHRALMLGTLARGRTTVHAPLKSEDTMRTLSCMTALGATVKESGDHFIIDSPGAGELISPDESLYTGNSGTTTRLITGLITGIGVDAMVNGDHSIENRPMDRVAGPLEQMGADIRLKDGKYPPVNIKAERMEPIEYHMPVASAQVKSAILFAGLFLDGDTIVHEIYPSRNHTELMFGQFGADVTVEGTAVTLSGGNTLRPSEVTVPGDISSAAFFMVLAAITPDSDITVENVSLNSTRAGIIEVFEQMGIDFEVDQHNDIGEPYGDIRIRYTPHIKPFSIHGGMIPRLIDEIPVLTLLAINADGKSTIGDAAELRYKETDRIRAVVDELSKCGVEFDVEEDGYTVHPRHFDSLPDTVFKGYYDHRIIMMLVILALSKNQEIHIDDLSAIDISYPGFLSDLMDIRSDA